MNGPTSRRRFLAALPALVFGACSTARRHRDGAPGAPGGTTTTALQPVPPAGTPSAGTPSSGAPAGAASLVRRGPGDRPLVAFTFHGSGDLGLFDDLLAVATAHRAPLTIFAVGQWLDANPGVARRILDAGHELANHTYTHPSLARVSGAGVTSEITRCRDALSRHGGSPGRWFRPSGVAVPDATILAAAGAAGYGTVVGYDVDPLDYQDPGAAAVRTRSAAGLHPGAIVSLHTGHRGTVDAMAGVLGDAVAAGLRPVTVSELLAP